MSAIPWQSRGLNDHKNCISCHGALVTCPSFKKSKTNYMGGVQHVAHGYQSTIIHHPPLFGGLLENTTTAIRSSFAGRPIKLPKITHSRRHGFEGGRFHYRRRRRTKNCFMHIPLANHNWRYNIYIYN